MEIITIILNFFTDSTKRITTKAMTLFSAIILIIFIDNIFSFTYYHNIDKKLSYIERINKISKDTIPSKEDITYLDNQKNEIIHHSTIKDRIWIFFEKNRFQYFFSNDNAKSTLFNSDKRSPIIHFITSSFLIIIVMIIIPFVAYADKSLTFAKATLAILGLEFILYATGFLVANLFAFIPIILDKPIINYTLNIVINIALIYIGYRISKK